MAERRKGIVARWLEGKERSEDYARSKLPTSRWALFWDIFKGRFGKLVLVNLMTLVTFLPLIALVVIRALMLTASGMSGPFGGGMGVGYPAIPNILGEAERLVFQTDLLFYGLMIPALAIAAVGVSGGMYIIRNLIWTEGIFVANDFLRGIKRNYLNVAEAMLLFGVVLFLARTAGNLANILIAVGAKHSGWMIASKVVGYVLVAIFSLICLWMVSLGVNYKQGPWQLFRNACAMTFGTLIQTVVFAGIAVAPLLLCVLAASVKNIILIAIALCLILFLVFSFAMLVWMDFSQWAFDKFINPNMGVATGRGLYDKNKPKQAADTGVESGAMAEYKRLIVAQGKSNLVCRPIKPIDDDLEIYQLPESFSRDDLRRLKESKQAVVEDTDAYAEEHKNDEQYVEYNRMHDEMQRAISEEEDTLGKKKKKKKKPARPEMLNKRK